MHPQSSKDQSSATRGGCLGKWLFLLVVTIISGTLGWVGAKFWLHRVEAGKPTLVSSPNNLDNSATDQHWERKSKNMRRRSQLGIDHSFFQALVNQLFWQEYPQRQGKPLSKDDREAQARWDELAGLTLDKLSNLSEQARQNLGKYSQQDHSHFIQQANQLHLSSKALNDLAEGEFLLLFPRQEIEISSPQPLVQVWLAVIFDLLTSLQEGNGYQEILVPRDNSPSEFTNTPEPTRGQAYVTRLRADEFITINLDADPSILFSIYSPSGRANLLQDSAKRQWAGLLPEDGYYEITLVSRGQTPLKYRLEIAIAKN